MLLIRADASVSMGTGHIMRCLALAQAWQDSGHQVSFACSELNDPLRNRLIRENCQVYRIDHPGGSDRDAAETAKLASRLNARCIVIDGYQFSYDYQQFLYERTSGTLVIDDYAHCDTYCADILLNQNISANSTNYSSTDQVHSFLLGTSYALLRREFLKRKPLNRKIPSVARTLLISLGGSDEDNFTQRVLEELENIKSPLFDVMLVAGCANPNIEALSEQVKSSSHHVELLVNVEDMAYLMQTADLAICAGGSSNWELSYFGVPRVLLILAENQIEIAHGLAANGASLLANTDLSDMASVLSETAVSPAIRESLTTKSKLLVDGQGVQRVVQAIHEIRS